MKGRIELSILLVFFLNSSFAATSNNALDAYHQGRYQEARALWSEQAKHQDFVAMISLGRLYQNGLGVKTNYATAMSWYQQATEAGSALGMFYLARLYEHGLGTDKDLDKAIGLYQQAVAKGHQRSKVALAEIYEAGKNGVKNVSLAKLLYKQEGSDRSLKRVAALNHSEQCLVNNHTRLFRMVLKCADRKSLRKAIVDQGLSPKLVTSANPGDAYYSAKFLKGSTELLVGYTRADQFATAKFVFPHRWNPDIIQEVKSELTAEFGAPHRVYGSMLNDKVLYKWVMEDGIEINLYRELEKRTTYLSYTYPEHRKLLIAELK